MAVAKKTKKRTKTKIPTTRKKNKTARRTVEENAETNGTEVKAVLPDSDMPELLETDITDVMPAALVEALNSVGDLSAADGYFLGAMGAKMVNCLSPLERVHLSNLLTPLIDKLHKDHF